MFLTKKSFRKILIMFICYLALAAVCFAAAAFFTCAGVEANLLWILGVTVCLLGLLIVFWGRYAEGKGKLVVSGNKLIRKELKPALFIEEYEALRNSEDLLIKRPCIEVLQLAAVAYDVLDQRKKALDAVNEMAELADAKRKNAVNLIKVSFLFSYGEIEAAEELFSEMRKQKSDAMCNALTDAILKGDRAMAFGDYKTVEANDLKLLQQTFPKLDNLTKLLVHYRLGEVYEKLNDKERATEHYRYCAENGGETAVRISAMSKLKDWLIL